ncbi:MAG: alcohol dehydrogenase catalytic domain-containing protein, partial [Chloroflexi bacterium]|nr:alcohol dehydrogenase catalytic domain-containing protein [Chloroflexota bacterium]
MKAVVVRETGGLESLQFEEIPDIKIGPAEVLVRVKAVSINFADTGLTRSGERRELRRPRILGGDAAGFVEEVGSAVRWVQRGQRVLVSPGISCGRCEQCLSGADNECSNYLLMGYGGWDGGYAQFVHVPEENIVPLPESLSFEQAACIPVTFITAWHMLTDLGRVRLGDDVLVTAAGSGVGVAGIQIARLHGARPIAAAGSDWKLEKAAELGAVFGVNYSREDWAQRVLDYTKGKGVEIVCDAAGGETFVQAIRALSLTGRAVSAAIGRAGALDLRQLGGEKAVMGVRMGSKASLVRMMRFFETGELKAVIHAVYPMEQVKKAHEEVIARQ